MNRIKVFIKKPGQNAYLSYIDNTLEALQKLVGGFIESVTLSEDLCIICNEEGRILGLEPNCTVCGVDFVGPIIFVGIDGDEFASIPFTYTGFKYCFPDLFKEE